MKRLYLGGRELVLVRMIPFIACPWLEHVELSGILAGQREISNWNSPESDGTEERNLRVTAFHLDDEGKPKPMQPSEWDFYYRNILALKQSLMKEDEKSGIPGSMLSVWRREATKALPPGVFLWRSDLEVLWRAIVDDFSSCPDEHPINWDANVMEWEGIISEGSERLMQGTGSMMKPCAKAEEQALREFAAEQKLHGIYFQEQAAALLGRTTKEILEMLHLPVDAKDSLTPYVYLNGVKATKVGRYKDLVLEDYNGLDGIKEPNTNRDVTLTGFYSVEGIRYASKTEVMKDLILSFGGKSRLLLHRGLDTFLLQENIRVKSTNLFVSAEEINSLIERGKQTGDNLQVTAQIERGKNSKPPFPSPSTLINAGEIQEIQKPWPLPKIDLPFVEGRAVLPLRTIPYFTQKIYKPLVLVEHLFNPYGHVVETLEAYRMSDGKGEKFDNPFNYWRGVKERLEGLKDNEDESILALPEGVFVDYQVFRDYISVRHAGMPENDDEKLSFNEGVKFLDDPYIPDFPIFLKEALYKGFEKCFERQKAIEVATPPGAAEPTESMKDECQMVSSTSNVKKKNDITSNQGKRGDAEFTQVLKSVIDQCIQSGTLSIVAPRNRKGFMEHVKGLVERKATMSDGVTTYDELVELVKTGSKSCIRMRNPKFKKGGKTKKDYDYLPSYITERLSKLRKEYHLDFNKEMS